MAERKEMIRWIILERSLSVGLPSRLGISNQIHETQGIASTLLLKEQG